MDPKPPSSRGSDVQAPLTPSVPTSAVGVDAGASKRGVIEFWAEKHSLSASGGTKSPGSPVLLGCSVEYTRLRTTFLELALASDYSTLRYVDEAHVLGESATEMSLPSCCASNAWQSLQRGSCMS